MLRLELSHHKSSFKALWTRLRATFPFLIFTFSVIPWVFLHHPYSWYPEHTHLQLHRFPAPPPIVIHLSSTTITTVVCGASTSRHLIIASCLLSARGISSHVIGISGSIRGVRKTFTGKALAHSEIIHHSLSFENSEWICNLSVAIVVHAPTPRPSRFKCCTTVKSNWQNCLWIHQDYNIINAKKHGTFFT